MLNALRLFLRRTFVDNLALKAISLATALLLFYFVREGKKETRSIALDVELSIPKGVVQTNEIARQVEVAVVGPKALVDTITPQSVGPLRVDLSPFGIGSSTLFLHKEMFASLPPAVAIVSISPSFLAVRLEKEESRVLPVTPIVKGQVAPGYRIDGYTITPRDATLIGPTSLVERIDFLETPAIDVNKADKTFMKTVAVRLPAPSMRLSLTEPVSVTVHIVEEIAERAIEAPVVLPEGVTGRAEPRSISVTLKGPTRLIDKLPGTELRAEPEATTLRLGTQTVALKLVGLPGAVARLSPLPKVKFIVEHVAPKPSSRPTESPAPTPAPVPAPPTKG